MIHGSTCPLGPIPPNETLAKLEDKGSEFPSLDNGDQKIQVAKEKGTTLKSWICLASRLII